MLKRYEDDHREQPILKGDLIIKNVSCNDSGLYICVADNDHDTASTATNTFGIVEIELLIF